MLELDSRGMPISSTLEYRVRHMALATINSMWEASYNVWIRDDGYIEVAGEGSVPFEFSGHPWKKHATFRVTVSLSGIRRIEDWQTL